MTRQRAVILEVIRSDKCHHTAEELFELAKLKLPTISRATVYNNLHALEEERIIRRIDTEDQVARYDSTFIPHGHLFCTDCGNIYDFSIPNFEATLGECSEAVVDSYDLRLRGLCRNCKIRAVSE